RPILPASNRSARYRACLDSRSRNSRCSRPARCGMSASSSPCAWRRRARRAGAEYTAPPLSSNLAPLPAFHDMRKARDAGTALVHEHWGDNVFLESLFEVDITPALDAPIKVTREISTARQCMSPLEGRGVVATFEHRLDQLTLYTG